ncbi:hypothetical protein [Acinetobacter sp. ANC 4648]|uniref:hypothetical protein n=1 Tax=Acinetobacter sp. ANC 4648 TaxID=1977875 RepID=UPI000A33F973|nr:hypothetical protein [Acinetobacter sp. ANC 4648]OTG82347.1 hypothetical protein B9T27_08920 [Acinetobacter sp. ANC 4648]
MQTYLKLNNEAYESFMEFVKHVLSQANSFGSRSSILSILAWILGSILAAITLSSIFKAEKWILIGLFALLVLMIFSVLVAFFFCLFTNKTDALRSEKFNIEKLAIEKHVPEDSLNGQLKTINSATNTKVLSTSVDSIEAVDDEA